jgi:hypothetical protein
MHTILQHGTTLDTNFTKLYKIVHTLQFFTKQIKTLQNWTTVLQHFLQKKTIQDYTKKNFTTIYTNQQNYTQLYKKFRTRL